MAIVLKMLRIDKRGFKIFGADKNQHSNGKGTHGFTMDFRSI